MPIPLKAPALLVHNWPIITGFIMGVTAFTVLTSDVSALKLEMKTMVPRSEHDKVWARDKEDRDQVRETLKEISTKLDRLLERSH